MDFSIAAQPSSKRPPQHHDAYMENSERQPEQTPPRKPIATETAMNATQTRRTKQALQESEERAREVAEKLSFALAAADLGDWEWDAATDLLRLSPRAAEIFGIPAEPVRTRTQVRELIHEEDRPKARLAVEQAAAHQGHYNMEYRVVRPDGRQVWVAANGRSRFGPQGQIIGMAGVVMDITARKRDAAELERARAEAERGLWQWQAVIQSMTEGLVLADIDGNLISMNPAALAIHEIASLGEMRKKIADYPDLFELHDLTGKHLPLSEWPISRVLRGERFSGYEVRVRRRDTGRQWVGSYGGTPVLDASGRLVLAVLTLRDVTEQRNTEDARRALLAQVEQQARVFDATLSSVRDYVFLFDREGRFRYANKLLLDLWGLTQEQAQGKSMRELNYSPDVETQLTKNIRLVFETGKAVTDETSYTSPTGQTGYFEYILAPVFDAEGRVEMVAGTSRDISERRRVEEERLELLRRERAARSEAERASRMKDEFLANLSHELRTPLNAILGWSHLLASGKGNQEDLCEGLRIIDRNAQAQAQIIGDLLDMSRIISGKVRLNTQRLDLHSVVQAAVETVRPAAEAKGIAIQCVLDPLAAPVFADPDRLQQVFWNLLSNAVKFTPRGGSVQVLLERADSHLEVSVIDSGEGISADFLPHVFERFRQSDAGTTRRHGGLGLGLAIVKQLAELHGGSVRAKSSGSGAGSTFTVSLPLTAVQPAVPTEQKCPNPAAQTIALSPSVCDKIAGVRVLVVDDEPDARALLRRLLEDCQAVVTTAASAQEAIEHLASSPHDVLVSDIGMPTVDGYELIRRIRALPPEQGANIPAIALTAYARVEDRTKTVLAGFAHHVAKPVEPAELISMVARSAGRLD